MDFNIDNQQKTLSGKASNLTLAEVLDYISKIPKLVKSIILCKILYNVLPVTH